MKVSLGCAYEQQASVWSYIPLEHRVPADHPLRAMRAKVDEVLRELSSQFSQLYAKVGRPSIAPERLLRALLLQVLYSVRSERLLMEQLDYDLLFPWFVGLAADDPIWDALATATKPFTSIGYASNPAPIIPVLAYHGRSWP